LLASTSAIERSRELLDYCLRGEPAPEQLEREIFAGAAADPAASSAFFRTVVERLGDLFEPRLCDVYAGLFSRAIEYVDPELRASDLVERYRRVRTLRTWSGGVQDIFVLSRITLGADVAVTSTILDGVHRRFPKANIWFVGPRKNWALFAGRPRVERLAFDYPRGGTLRDRIESWRRLRDFFERSDGIVIDPDSRLTQLGLLPVCPEERYLFFESRGYGGNGSETLVQLTRRWMSQTFGVDAARPFVAPVPASDTRYEVTVSFGVGENDEKRIGEPFERELLSALSGRQVLVDTGAGGPERDRVLTGAAGLRNVRTYEGDYAPFAAIVAQSDLYVGYDSAGQHVAAAAGVPLVSVFAGYVSERMFSRWRPSGRGTVEVVKVAPGEAATTVLERTLDAVRSAAR
jgi:hypothetical protein